MSVEKPRTQRTFDEGDQDLGSFGPEFAFGSCVAFATAKNHRDNHSLFGGQDGRCRRAVWWVMVRRACSLAHSKPTSPAPFWRSPTTQAMGKVVRVFGLVSSLCQIVCAGAHLYNVLQYASINWCDGEKRGSSALGVRARAPGPLALTGCRASRSSRLRSLRAVRSSFVPRALRAPFVSSHTGPRRTHTRAHASHGPDLHTHRLTPRPQSCADCSFAAETTVGWRSTFNFAPDTIVLM